MTRFYCYRAELEAGDDPDVTVVTFPNVPEAITEGSTPDEARANAMDALGTALLAYARAGRALPVPSDTSGARGGVPVMVAWDVSAKLAVLEAFRASGLSQRELAERLGKDEKQVRRLLDPMHASKVGAMAAALEAMGERLVIGVQPLAA